MFPKIVVPPNHPNLIGFSIINHPFWGTPILGNTHMSEENMFLFFSYAKLDGRLLSVTFNARAFRIS